MDEQAQPQQPTNQEFQSLPSQGEPLQPPPNKTLWIYLLIVLVVAGGAFGFYIWQKGGLIPTHIPSPVACTKDALRCSDGTVVGRTGPNCEFVCPPDLTANWQTYRNEEYGFEVKYPKNFFIDGETNVMDIYSAEGLIFFVSFANEKENTASIERIKNRGLKEYRVIDGKQAFYSCLSDNCVPDEGSLMFFDYPAAGDVLFIGHNSTSIANQIFSTFRFIPPTSLGTSEPEICIQVITPARNPQTGETRDFPTPCDVPEGWEKI